MAVIKTKMFKYSEDECYGAKFNTIEQCEACWLIDPCEKIVNNTKKKEREEKRNTKLKKA